MDRGRDEYRWMKSLNEKFFWRLKFDLFRDDTFIRKIKKKKRRKKGKWRREGEGNGATIESTRRTKAWNETFCSRITLDRIPRYGRRIFQDRRKTINDSLPIDGRLCTMYKIFICYKLKSFIFVRGDHCERMRTVNKRQRRIEKSLNRFVVLFRFSFICFGRISREISFTAREIIPE